MGGIEAEGDVSHSPTPFTVVRLEHALLLKDEVPLRDFNLSLKPGCQLRRRLKITANPRLLCEFWRGGKGMVRKLIPGLKCRSRFAAHQG
ncbi:hypothetical protein CEXT_12261 [Caerostris extrusa]|uniref:Uncharacterized protein n=1 Tax=Caerostris extrusa TaxID=172846 RepID=A0AAV4SHB6_CAEEX|nr:hypothetical protein CEXT_12261 [Caerostris extrusa]